jgi:hypothetical protein
MFDLSSRREAGAWQANARAVVVECHAKPAQYHLTDALARRWKASKTRWPLGLSQTATLWRRNFLNFYQDR